MRTRLPIVIALLLCTFFVTIKAADNPYIKITAVDANGQRDSVLLTLDDNATMGIDTAFGEANIYGMPHSSLDVRLIQRNQKSGIFNDITHGQQQKYFWYNTQYGIIISTNNIDLKKEFRTDKDKGVCGDIYIEYYINIVIQVNADNYPVYIYAENNNFYTSADWRNVLFGLLSSNDYSYILESSKGYIYKENKDPILTISSKESNWLIGFFTNYTGSVDDEIGSPNHFSIYPTIAEDKITISSDITGETSFKIYSIDGSLIESLTIGTSPYTLDISGYPKGIYFIQSNGRVEKFIKY